MAGKRITALSILQDLRKEAGLAPAPKKEPALIITSEIKEAVLKYVIKNEITGYNNPGFIANASVLKAIDEKAAGVIKDLKSKKLSLSVIGLDSSAIVTPEPKVRKPRTVKAKTPAAAPAAARKPTAPRKSK